MKLSRLLQRTAVRYEAAVDCVLSRWQPECGCQRPGSLPRCEACPCLPVFESLVREEIHVSQSLDSSAQ